jgi:hypothetical protein
MTDDPVAGIARAVLYEGYVLWPYRRSALKNSHRWTFGGVYPPAHSYEHPDDACELRAECLVEGPPGAPVDVSVRFLQVVRRQPLDHTRAPVDELDGILAWDEAIERECVLRAPGRATVHIHDGLDRQRISGGTLVRSWEALHARVVATTDEPRDGVRRLRVRVVNTTPFAAESRADALRHTLVSTHVVLRSAEAEFVSATDPPADLRDLVDTCENDGVWPVLVGDRHTMLASPIILPDHPQVAPESPGDLFDGGEIDALLILNVLALTEEEQREARASDPLAREILDRCAGLSNEELMRLHGAIRERVR